jgi:hypothetical protein
MSKEEKTPNGKPSIPDNEIIERFGGIRPMAAKLGVAVTTVQGWKERGHIPPGRIPQIIAAAAEHDIDIGLQAEESPAPPEPEEAKAESKSQAAAVKQPEAAKEPEPAPRPEPEPEPQKTAESAKGSPESAKPTVPAGTVGGVSRLSFFLAVVLLVAAILTGPLWQSRLYPGTATGPAIDTGRLDEIAGGLRDIEAGLKNLASDIETRESGLSARIDALEAGGGETGAAFADQLAGIEQGLDSLKSGLEAIESRIAGLEARQGDVPESVTTALQATDSAIAELRSEIAELNRKAGSLESGLASVGGNIGDLDGRISELEARPVQSGEKIAALVLALGQVEAAMNTGRPYREALDRFEFLGRDDPLISDDEALAALAPWADFGIPDRLALRRRFGELAPGIDHALSGAGEDGWLDSVWNRITGLVTIRRLDGGDLSPIAQAERALEAGDLVAAAAAFENKGSLGPDGEAWLNLVNARIDAEREIGELYGRMVAPLAGKGAEGAGSQ